MKQRSTLLMTIFAVMHVSAYPYTPLGEIVLTDDYGIVPQYLIDYEKKTIAPECWTFHEECPTRYWQCIDLEGISMHCEPAGEIEENVRAYSPILGIEDQHIKWEFSTRRPFGLENCLSDLRAWRGLFDGERIACFGAVYGGVEQSVNPQDLRPTQYWIVDFVSSKRGDWSYF